MKKSNFLETHPEYQTKVLKGYGELYCCKACIYTDETLNINAPLHWSTEDVSKLHWHDPLFDHGTADDWIKAIDTSEKTQRSIAKLLKKRAKEEK